MVIVSKKCKIWSTEVLDIVLLYSCANEGYNRPLNMIYKSHLSVCLCKHQVEEMFLTF